MKLRGSRCRAPWGVGVTRVSYGCTCNQNSARLINQNGAMLMNQSGTTLVTFLHSQRQPDAQRQRGKVRRMRARRLRGHRHRDRVGTYTQTDLGSVTSVIAGGSMTQGSITISGGTLEGGGTINNSTLPMLGARVAVNNGGKVNPGLIPSDPNTLTINGTFTLDNATLAINIAGTGPGQFAKLTIDGMAFFTGVDDLVFSLIDGFAPNTGDMFEFLTSASIDMSGLLAPVQYVVYRIGTRLPIHECVRSGHTLLQFGGGQHGDFHSPRTEHFGLDAMGEPRWSEHCELAEVEVDRPAERQC
jgi:hypothetical protein